MGRGYSGNHPRFSHRQDERYDAKEAYNKDLTASARLHYLENDRHDHESPAHSHCSPMHRHNDRHIRREAKQIARKNEGDEQDIYYELKAQIDDERSQPRGNMTRHIRPKPKVKADDERSGEIRNEMIDEMIDYRPDSPMNNNHFRPGDYSPELRKRLDAEFPARPDFPSGGGVKPKPTLDDKKDPKPPMPEPPFSGRGGGVIRRKPDKAIDDRYGSPMNACAKSEGGSGCIKQMGGAWRVISNKTDKPWPAKYASKSKAEAALRGYHAG